MTNEEISLDTKDFLDLIHNALHYRKPVSAIRYGDGETMMLGDDVEERSFILKKVLGYIPSDEDTRLMIGNLIEAYRNCNVIGVPTQRHLAREDRWKDSLNIFKKIISEETLHKKPKVSVDVFYNMIAANAYQELFAGQTCINYISCRNLDNVFKERFAIKNVNSFIISPEPTYTSGYVGDKHFPEQFNQIKEWIGKLDCTGQLCLVGAGIPGKIYNNWFRDVGGVSLDIGSVFDAWAGKKTRGAGRGLDAIDETNKL